MNQYAEMTLKQFADLARNSCAELGSMSNGLMVNYETGKYFQVADEETALFLASSREMVLELVKRLIALESPPPVAAPATVFPKYPARCQCTVFGGGDKDFVCLKCGGGRF